MKVDWTNGEHLDGPGFYAWLVEQGIVREPVSDREWGASTARTLRAWRNGAARATYLRADALLAETDHHISEIPDELWVDEPAVHIKQALLSGLGVKEIARTTGVAPATVRWHRGQLERSVA